MNCPKFIQEQLANMTKDEYIHQLFAEGGIMLEAQIEPNIEYTAYFTKEDIKICYDKASFDRGSYCMTIDYNMVYDCHKIKDVISTITKFIEALF